MLVNIHAAKTQFSKLVERAASGEEIVIGRAGVPVAKLVAYTKPEQREPRRFGYWAGKVTYADDWDSEETNAEIARWFYEEGSLDF